MAITTLLEYPAPPGNKYFQIVDVDGPASYTQVSGATPPTGGQSIKATDIGMQSIDWAQAMGDDNGTHDGVCYVIGGLGNPRSGGTPNVSQPGSSIILQWIVSNTGAELGGGQNVSGRHMRLLVLGR